MIRAYQDQSAGKTSENVREGSLVHRGNSLLAHDLHRTIDRSFVLALVLATGHHHSTTNGVQRIAEETGADSGGIRNTELGPEASVLEGIGLSDGIIETVAY